MTLRSRLIPAAALVVAIGASVAGAATAEAGTGATTGGTHTTQKPVACKVSLPSGTLKKGSQTKGSVQPPAGECKKKVERVSLDKIASELGVPKTTLVQALTETKQWVVAAKTKPSVAQFEQHLADQLHVPLSKLVSVFGAA